MKLLISTLLIIHISAGAISLILFWVPVISKKGSKIHNKSGMWYVYSMVIVVVSAALLSIKNMIYGHYEAAAFLGHLTILTSYPLWYGVTIVKYKKELPPIFITIRRVFTAMLTLSSIGLLIYAYVLNFQGEAILMIIFAALGITNITEVFKSKAKIQKATNWIIEHISGMIVSGIAAYTAFFAFGGRTMLGDIFTGQWMIIPWVMPTIVGVAIIRIMKKRYRKQ